MPAGDTKFCAAWLSQKDCNGHILSQWCKADSTDKCAAYCVLCSKKVPCSNMGIAQVLQHSTGKKHTTIANTRFGTGKEGGQRQFVVLSAPQQKLLSAQSGNAQQSSSDETVGQQKPLPTIHVSASRLDQVVAVALNS